jgi:pseudoazurin
MKTGEIDMSKFRAVLIAAATLAGIGLAPAAADNFDVQLLNKGDAGAMVFQPALSHVAVGDTVTFKAVDKGHNVETIPGMLPEGAQPSKGENSKDLVVTFTVPGAYGFKCAPHYAMGMVGLVVVGDLAAGNLDAVKAVQLPSKAHERFETIFADLAKLK